MSNSSKYGYTALNYKNCCPDNVTIKTIVVSKPESQHIINITSCCSSFVKSKKNGTNQHDSYDRVLRRRRGQAFKK